MALYRINRRNALFQGLPGDFIRVEPDPLMDAAVKSGIVSRWDTEEPAKTPVSNKSKKRKTDQGKAVVVRMSDVDPGGSDGGEDTTGGDTEHTG